MSQHLKLFIIRLYMVPSRKPHCSFIALQSEPHKCWFTPTRAPGEASFMLKANKKKKDLKEYKEFFSKA